MKKLLLIIPLFGTLFMISCRKDEHLVTYPKSYPTIEQAEVAEPTITYGDSITLSVSCFG